MSESSIPGSTGGQHPLAGLIDHNETYGSHLIRSFVADIPSVGTAIDIGAGSGRDLATVKAVHPQARTIAIEAGREYARALEDKVDEVHVLNIERDPFPFADGSIDVVIANQILEHTKEVFWIFHQVARVLAPGGHFIFGVPNVLSAHNRLLALLGRHPTQHKLYSAHVRPFSRRDTVAFLEVCSPGTFAVEHFSGSQFYPFPRAIARPLSRLLPNMAFSIFFSIKKVGPYADGFVKLPGAAGLETNFFVGDSGDRGQY
ncbi:MAG TPA: class I SAM-dependent methyltransferase [Sphingomonas sp.]|jgi:SAM-dependent methyltransferase